MIRLDKRARTREALRVVGGIVIAAGMYAAAWCLWLSV